MTGPFAGYQPTCHICGAPLDYSRINDGQILGACGRRWQLLPDGRDGLEWVMRPGGAALDPCGVPVRMSPKAAPDGDLRGWMVVCLNCWAIWGCDV
jgi:hypothetical protein